MKFTLVLLSVILAVNAESIEFKNCPDSQGQTGHALAVDLSPCPQQPCDFKRGDSVNVKITFQALEDSPVLNSTVYGVVLGIPVAFPLPNPDGCKESNVACPIQKGQNYTYSSSFPVLDSYPEITLVVMWKLDSANTNNVCFTFPMSISKDEGVVG